MLIDVKAGDLQRLTTGIGGESCSCSPSIVSFTERGNFLVVRMVGRGLIGSCVPAGWDLVVGCFAIVGFAGGGNRSSDQPLMAGGHQSPS